MNFSGGQAEPFEELPRWQQVASIAAAFVLPPIAVTSLIVFVSAPVVGIGVGVTGQPILGLGLLATGLATWVLSWLLLGL